MLDDRDEQVLAAIEIDIGAEDPGLRSRLERRRLRPTWPAVVAVAGAVVALVLMVALGLVGNAFLLLLVTTSPLALRLRRRGRLSPAAWRRRP